MAEEPRFDWPSIFRASAIISGVPTVLGFLIPVALTLALRLVKTGYVAGNELFNWGFWVAAWALTVWQGAWVIRHVGTKIIDDMLVIAMISAAVLIVMKFIIGFAYEPLASDGTARGILSGIDGASALVLIVVALVAARLNQY